MFALALPACTGGGGGSDGGTGTGTDSNGTGTTDSTTTSSTGETTGTSTTSTTTTTTATTTATTAADTSTGSGGPVECVQAECQGKLYQCGDCMDNDGDGDTDVTDTDCWGPCDDNESGWKGEVPGQQNNPTCEKMDCYFDQDGGSGNDDCYWSHACDPLEPMGCTYDPNWEVAGTNSSCAELDAMQTDECLEQCLPLVPKGCDCFGCCEVHKDGEVHTVYIGTEDQDDNGTCNVDNVADPVLCNPCTPVEGCFKPCNPDDCEICIGQNEIPEDCDDPKCDDGQPVCDPQNGHADCPDQWLCVSGCCVMPPP